MTAEDVRKAQNIAVQLLPTTRGVSEEEIEAAVLKVMGLVPLDPQEQAQLVRDLQAAYTVSVGAAGALDGGANHIEWLAERRTDIDWNLWLRYMRYLQEEKGFPPPVVNRLDEVTDQILQRLEDPKRAGAWDRRGMVVGHVQSGKTANYTGLICKAADAGYKVIVVLAGVDDSLRSQTQLRLDEGLLGFDTQQRRNYDQANSRIGVGRLSGAVLYPVNSLTSSAQKGDFKKSTAKQIGVNPGGNDPLLLVVKKNKSILNNLISWITSFDAQVDGESDRPVVHGVPLLVIDDECDHASVNTKNDDPDLDPTAINRGIRSLLASFERSAYVGYTATPFANIFITPESSASEQHGEDLFPRDFIISLKRPSDYIGATRVFGLEADTEIGLESVEALPITRTVSDQEDWLPTGHKNGHQVPSPMPESLRNALLSFVLVCAARRARGQGTAHNSMLVHVTRFTSVQGEVADQIEDELGFIKQRIKYGDGERKLAILEELRELWEKDFVPTTEAFADPDLPPVDWSEIVESLEPAVSKIEVRTVNGLSIEALEYFNKPAGISVIAVGGAKLSRGLTLEGLSVSYYLRTSRMYDTLLQMGRWFGFRPGYTDLCRLYTTDELQRWYKDTALANEDLLLQFDEMAISGGNPADFGLRVRQSADGLVVTAAGKMRNGTRMKLTFSGSISETINFDPAEAVISANFEAVNDLVRRMDVLVEPEPRGKTAWPNLVWTDIDGEIIADFLDEFRTHPQATKAQSSVMAKYIRARVKDTIPELTQWTVALLSNPEAPVEIAGHTVGRTTRGHFPADRPSSDVYAIRRLLSPSDEQIDLTPDELEEAQLRTKEWWERGLIKSKASTAPTQANGRAIRLARPASRGLLLIYALDESQAAGVAPGTPIMGLAVSFPESQTAGAGAIEYVVNYVYSQLELELE
jgi:hypothetical protein